MQGRSLGCGQAYLETSTDKRRIVRADNVLEANGPGQNRASIFQIYLTEDSNRSADDSRSYRLSEVPANSALEVSITSKSQTPMLPKPITVSIDCDLLAAELSGIRTAPGNR
jgi:hypothetical protein